MSYFVHGGKLEYADYLTAKSFSADLQSDTGRTGERVTMAVSRQTREVLASNEALARENILMMKAGLADVSSAMRAGLSDMTSVLDEGFEQLSYELQSISEGISELNATFHWGFAQMLAGIGHMNDSFDELIKISKTPTQTAAYEHYEIARDAFRQGLYAESLESLDKAISGDHTTTGYKLDWRFHQMKGTIRLGFSGGDADLVDLSQAEEAFRMAARYAKADYPEHAGQALLSAGWAAYCQGRMKETLAFTEQALAVQPSLGEALFLTAKVQMAVGDVRTVLPVLKKAIELDRFYALKAAGDGDFQAHDDRLRDFLAALRKEKFDQLALLARDALERSSDCLEQDAGADRHPAAVRLEAFLADGEEWPLLDLLERTQQLKEDATEIQDVAKAVFVATITRSPRGLVELERDVPEQETYQEEVIIRPRSLFRKEVRETREMTRTVIKSKLLARAVENLRVDIRTGLGDAVVVFDFCEIPGGTFEMGDIFGDGSKDERPVHSVTISDFYLGKTPVTQAQWQAVMGSNPSHNEGCDRPVENVSWYDVQAFLSRLYRTKGCSFRIPTEAEWEYAARSGGKKEKWAGTSSESELGQFAWHNRNSCGESQPVAGKRPNGLGLYDMSGNVLEWCQDRYGGYSSGAQRDPCGPNLGSARTSRVFRGGSWGGGRGANTHDFP